MVCLLTRVCVNGDGMANSASEHEEVPDKVGEAQSPCAVECHAGGVEDTSRQDQSIAR